VPDAPSDPYADDEVLDTEPAPVRSGSAKDGAKAAASPFANMSDAAARPSPEVATAGVAPADVAAADVAAPDAPRPRIPGGAVVIAEPPRADTSRTPRPSTDVATIDAPHTASANLPTTAPSTEPSAPASTRLERKQVDAALSDFGALAASVDGTFTPTGLRLDKVTPGSLFARAGLVTGDTITAIDGKPLRSIDDAADLYARAGGMKAATVQLVRAGKPHTLRLEIK